MLTRPIARKCLVPAALVLGLVGVYVAPRAFARVVVNTIDTVATVADNGRRIVLAGPIANDQTEWDDLRVTITQRSTGAVAEGRARILGTTSVQQWVVEAAVQGSATFEEGPATAVAVATSTLQGQVTDAHQWLVQVTLVAE